MYYVNYLRDPLRKNSVLLVAAKVTDSLLGFVFWMVIVHMHDDHEVGLAASIVAAGMLLATFSRLGLDIAVVRYLSHERNRARMINSCYTLAGIFSALAATAYVLGLDIWSPPLAFLGENAVYCGVFVLLTIAINLRQIQMRVFTALRAAEYALFQTLITALRFVMAFILVGFSVIGIVSSWALAIGTAFLIAALFTTRLQKDYRPIPTLDRDVLSRLMRFSIGNYIGESIRVLPRWIFPLIIVNVLAPEMSGYFYIAWSIAAVLNIISLSLTHSLLAEASHDPERIRYYVVKMARLLALILLPLIAGILLLGEMVLSIYGEGYVENGLPLLWLLAIAAIPDACTSMYVTMYRIQEKVRPIMGIYVFVTAFTIGVGYMLMTQVGLWGIGIAWLSANSLVAITGLARFIRFASVASQSHTPLVGRNLLADKVPPASPETFPSSGGQ